MLLRLRSVPDLRVSENVRLSDCTRFGIGGPAELLVDAETDVALAEALRVLRENSFPHTVIGGGTNLIANDRGFAGAVVRYTNPSIEVEGLSVRVAAGAVLQNLVDRTISLGLAGLETLTGIPGWVGGAVYGNAGAYGHSIHERIRSVQFMDTTLNQPLSRTPATTMDKATCEFRYRESIFKRNKDWIILSAELDLDRGNAADLLQTAADIRKIRDEKYPPSMRCAGSIFKNLILAELPEAIRAHIPERVIREGKVPSAYFLEQTGSKGLLLGGMKVADYHANLIYNEGGGTAGELRQLINELKRRVREHFGIELEEEVQFL